MLRSVVLTSAIALGLAAPALAQAAPADAVSWTGPYVGVNLGYGGGDFNYPYSGTTDAAGTHPVAGSLHQASRGVLGGGQIGYNVETGGGLVLGLETDIDGTNINGDASASGVDGAGDSDDARFRSRIDYLGTVRGRLGMAMYNGRFLPYVTGGLAYGDVTTGGGYSCSACGTGGAAVSSGGSQTTGRTGWTVGAGTEYALDRHTSFRVEYLYTDLGAQTLANGAATLNGPGFNLYNAAAQTDTTANVIRVGLNYRF